MRLSALSLKLRVFETLPWEKPGFFHNADALDIEATAHLKEYTLNGHIHTEEKPGLLQWLSFQIPHFCALQPKPRRGKRSSLSIARRRTGIYCAARQWNRKNLDVYWLNADVPNL